MRVRSDQLRRTFEYLSTETSFNCLLKKHCVREGKARYDVISAAAQLDIGYVYRLVSGEKAHPSANTVIRLALALNLTVSETDELLMVAGHAPLVIP